MDGGSIFLIVWHLCINSKGPSHFTTPAVITERIAAVCTYARPIIDVSGQRQRNDSAAARRPCGERTEAACHHMTLVFIAKRSCRCLEGLQIANRICAAKWGAPFWCGPFAESQPSVYKTICKWRSLSRASPLRRFPCLRACELLGTACAPLPGHKAYCFPDKERDAINW